jgi:hypothetical protein
VPDPVPPGECDSPVELFDQLGNPLRFDDLDVTGLPTLTADRPRVEQPIHPDVTKGVEPELESDQEWESDPTASETA